MTFPLDSEAVNSQIILGFSGEYRYVNIYGQSNGVPSYKGVTYTPELQYAIASRYNSIRIYGNFGFGTLKNTANSVTLSEEFKYRVYGGGIGFYYGGFWFRTGLNYHTSRDEVSGSTPRVIDFKGPGLEFGTGFKFDLSAGTALVGGLRLQLAKFSSESSPYFQGRRDYVSYAAFLGLDFIVPSTVFEGTM